MSGKKYFVAAVASSSVVAAFAACFCGHLAWSSQDGAVNQPGTTLSAGEKFGPVTETILPASQIDDHKIDFTAASASEPEILDLETGRFVRQESLERFRFRPAAIMAWIRSKGLDISCNVWSSGAACVTYDMIVVPIEGNDWDKITEKEILGNPALGPRSHVPRRLLVLAQNRPDTYLFRTGDGTLGILRIVGLSENGQGVKIRYKLIISTPSDSRRVDGKTRLIEPAHHRQSLLCVARRRTSG